MIICTGTPASAAVPFAPERLVCMVSTCDCVGVLLRGVVGVRAKVSLRLRSELSVVNHFRHCKKVSLSLVGYTY